MASTRLRPILYLSCMLDTLSSEPTMMMNTVKSQWFLKILGPVSSYLYWLPVPKVSVIYDDFLCQKNKLHKVSKAMKFAFRI